MANTRAKMSDLEYAESGQAAQDLYSELMAAKSEAAQLRDALELVLFGLTNKRNCCWPTTKAWTKKERDEAMLEAVRGALFPKPKASN